MKKIAATVALLLLAFAVPVLGAKLNSSHPRAEHPKAQHPHVKHAKTHPRAPHPKAEHAHAHHPRNQQVHKKHDKNPHSRHRRRFLIF